MALTAKEVYAILKHQISDMEAKLNSPVRYRGTVATADLLPLNPDIGDMYNIESKSIYGEAGMNVAWNGVVWDTMGAPIDMSLYLTKEGADTIIQNMVNEYLEKNPVKPGATTEQAQQIEQNKTDIVSLKTETGSLKEEKVDKPSITDNGKIPRANNGDIEWANVGQPTDEQTSNAVTSWLNEHPEATTTVQDRSLTMDKMVIGTFGYVTPEMFGAKGDGVTDDTQAIQMALNNNKRVRLNNKTYLVSKTIKLNNYNILEGLGYDSVLRCAENFNGNLILIDSVFNTEVRNLTLHGGSVFDYGTDSFTKLNGEGVNGIYCDHTKSHIAICRLRNVQIILFSGIGFIVQPATYEIIANTIVIKNCYKSGMNCRATDSQFDNFYIGLNAYEKKNLPGCNLEGANNNYSNFKVYLNKNGGVTCEDGTNNNNYSNFNIQENNKNGLNINGGSAGIAHNNFRNIILDSNETAIKMWNCGNNVISGMVTSKVSSIKTEHWIVAYGCTEDNYIDVIASAGTTNTDNQHLIFTKSQP